MSECEDGEGEGKGYRCGLNGRGSASGGGGVKAMGRGFVLQCSDPEQGVTLRLNTELGDRRGPNFGRGLAVLAPGKWAEVGLGGAGRCPHTAHLHQGTSC